MGVLKNTSGFQNKIYFFKNRASDLKIKGLTFSCRGSPAPIDICISSLSIKKKPTVKSLCAPVNCTHRY